MALDRMSFLAEGQEAMLPVGNVPEGGARDRGVRSDLLLQPQRRASK